MNFLRKHWFDLGIPLAVVTGGYAWFSHAAGVSLLLWLSLIFLFLHQFEEYRFPGYFPGMVNLALFQSAKPDRYPLNAQTSLVVNVGVGWLVYLLAALCGPRAIWLGIAIQVVNAGNCIAHIILFNLRLKSRYNPGMATAIVLLLPIVVLFFAAIIREHLTTPLDWALGLLLGVALNWIGILKMIDWMKDENTLYPFPARCLMPRKSDESPQLVDR